MTASKEFYQIAGTGNQALENRLNHILARISDRLDKLEGFRGELETASGTFTGGVDAESVTVKDSNDTQLHSME